MAFIALFQGTAAEAHLPSLKQSLGTLERESKEQPGTIRYEFYQSEEDPAVIMLFGMWETEADFRAHVASDAHRRHEASLPSGAWAIPPIMREWRTLSD